MPRILSPEDSQVGDGDRVGLAHGGSSSRTLAVALYTSRVQSSNFFRTCSVKYLDWYYCTLIIDGFTSIEYNGVTLVRLLTFVPIAGP